MKIMNRFVTEAIGENEVSLTQLSRTTGYSVSKLRNIVNEVVNVTPKEAKVILDALGVSLSEVLRGY